MARLLYLVHRLPYPPNKGDKVRSFHLLKHLARTHEVHLGTFIDDPDDEQHVDKVRSLRGLFSGEALSLPYYRRRGMQLWIDACSASQAFDAVVVFSSVMAQYVPAGVPALVDFVDADSAKWTAYAADHRWPMSWIYRREGRRLLDFERKTARTAQRAFFVTAAEAALFTRHAPECSACVEVMGNGVDADFFAPEQGGSSPYTADELPLVFTGAMDYWPNIDAVEWFVAEVMPGLRRQWPQVRLHIVGRSPTAAVQALAGADVMVSGTVPDVRPYLAHAAVVVAPLRIARGVQNKILEAMAMARPVVAAAVCSSAITAEPGRDLMAADSADDYVTAISRLLADPLAATTMGRHGRRQILAHYSWDAHLAAIDHHVVAHTKEQGAKLQ
jgi:sugar transferase (PEP-CTERM/EpsH1 system associated)